MRSMFILMLTVLVAGSCFDGGSQPEKSALLIGESVILEGQVTEVDSRPMFVDGDGLIFVKSEVYGDIIIRIPARKHLCQALGLDTFSSIITGDSIKAMGRVTKPRELTVCADESHFLEKLTNAS